MPPVVILTRVHTRILHSCKQTHEYNFNKSLLDVTSIATSSTPSTSFSSATMTQTLSQSSKQPTTEVLHTSEVTPIKANTEQLHTTEETDAEASTEEPLQTTEQLMRVLRLVPKNLFRQQR